jgi:hypothetical protein
MTHHAAAGERAPGMPPLPVHKLWTQKEAAAYLGVSVSYLRASDCPKVLLPSTSGRTVKPIVRYRPRDIEAWVEEWTARALHATRREKPNDTPRDIRRAG